VLFTGKGKTDSFADNQECVHFAPLLKIMVFSLVVAKYMGYSLNSRLLLALFRTRFGRHKIR
jgi:hypothetical protein